MKKAYFFFLALVAMMICPAGMWAQTDAEALWGSDADNLTMSGTLKQAIDAANAGQASYIQLQMSMTNSTYYYFSGAYAATLDLNGDTINASVTIKEGFALTIVDSSEEQTGLVSCEEVSVPAMRLENAGILNLRGGKIQNLNTIVVTIKGVNSTANIYGGTVESGNNSVIDIQPGSFLNITGGRFISGSYYLFYLQGHTTISGGEFVFDTTQDQSRTFTLFDTSTLDLSQYPTTATEGVTPIEEFTLFSYDPITVADAITLPEGYCVLDKEGNKVDEIKSGIYHIGLTPEDPPTSVENTYGPSPSTKSQKILRDGQLFILRDGKEYTILGQPAQ